MKDRKRGWKEEKNIWIGPTFERTKRKDEIKKRTKKEKKGNNGDDERKRNTNKGNI